MDFREDIDKLPPATPRGEIGTALRQFSGLLDPVSAQEIARAVEEHCERVDVGEW